MKLVEAEFGGPKQMTFSEMAERNIYNKICSLKQMNISHINLVNSQWVIINMDLSRNKLAKFPVELAKLQTLQILKLDENLIQEVKYEELLQFKSLDQLDIRNNNMKRFCVDFNDLPISKKAEVYHSHLKVGYGV